MPTLVSGTDLRLVFEPFALNGVTLANRIVRTSQGTGLTANGLVSEHSAAWHLARARGGLGGMFLEPGQVHWSSPAFLDYTGDEVVESVARLTSALHDEGAKVFQQFMHGGPTNIPVDGSAPWSASHVPDPGLGMLPVPLTAWMIDEVVDGFAAAARRAQQAGVDGVEVHAGHGYLFSAFLSPATNRRTDAYGGSFENRCRLLVQTLRAMREAVGSGYVIGVRLSPDGPEDQTTIADVADIARLLEAEGLIDYVNVSYGSHYQRDLLMGGVHEPPGYQRGVAAAVRARVGLPILAAGRMATLADAEELLTSGVADLVSMTRATIADPDLVRKTRAGRADEVRPCIACNQACAGGLNTKGKVTCTVNAAAGRELGWADETIRPAASPGHLVVVGGGPAGLEAARVGALAGHRVTLLEAADRLGGQLRLAARSPHRAGTAAVIPYFERALELLDVDVRTGHRADAAAVAALVPDAIVVAAGATPRIDGFQTWLPGRALPGLAEIELLTGWDVLAGAPLGERVLLLDELGHYESLDVAEQLVGAGHEVHLVTRYSTLAANLEMRWEMIGAVHVARFLGKGLHLHARSLVLEVGPGRADIASLEARDQICSLAVDTHVFMSGHLPDRELQSALAELGVPLRVVGDANGPRLLEAAVFEGNQAVRSLEPGVARVRGVRFGQTGSAI